MMGLLVGFGAGLLAMAIFEMMWAIYSMRKREKQERNERTSG